MDDLDRQLRQLLDQEAARPAVANPLAAMVPPGLMQLDHRGLPVDPALQAQYDRIVELGLRDRHAQAMELDRQARAERAQERAEIEAHRARLAQQQPAWQHPTWQPPAFHVHLNLGGQPYHQPAPPPWQPVGQLYTAPSGPPDDAQFMRRTWIGIVACALLTLAVIWALAAGMQARAEQHIQQDQHYSTTTTQGAKP